MDSVMTLLEASKLLKPSYQTGVIEIYASAYHPMTQMPVKNAFLYHWTLEESLAHTSGGKRNVNADYTATQGTVAPYESQPKIYGGKVQVDDYIRDNMPESMQFQLANQIRSLAREFTVDMFEGTGGTSLRGIQDWISNDVAYAGQVVNAGTGGALLTEVMLDELASMMTIIDGRTFIYCNDVVSRRLKNVCRTTSTMQYSPDQFGYFSYRWNGIPIVTLMDGKNAALLSQVENDGNGNLDTTSLYMVTYGDELFAAHSSNPDVAPNGVPVPKFKVQNDGSNYTYERMDWYVNTIPHTPKCIGRLNHINCAVA